MESGKGTGQAGQGLRGITSDLKRYIEKRIELLMINFGEYISRWVVIFLQRSAGAFLILGGICFLLVALAVYLESVLPIPGLGFVIVSIPLLVMGIMFIYLKPDRLFEELQELIEEEVVEAVEQNSGREPGQLEAPGRELEHFSNKE